MEARLPNQRTRKHTKAETKLRETSGTETAHERMKARPEAKELADPKEVWKDGEATPAQDRAQDLAQGGAGRVADAGDVGAGQASSYGTEAQADALARQTQRSGKPPDVEKPKRG